MLWVGVLLCCFTVLLFCWVVVLVCRCAADLLFVVRCVVVVVCWLLFVV